MTDEYGTSPAMLAVRALAAKAEAASQHDLEEVMRLTKIEEADASD